MQDKHKAKSNPFFGKKGGKKQAKYLVIDMHILNELIPRDESISCTRDPFEIHSTPTSRVGGGYSREIERLESIAGMQDIISSLELVPYECQLKLNDPSTFDRQEVDVLLHHQTLGFVSANTPVNLLTKGTMTKPEPLQGWELAETKDFLELCQSSFCSYSPSYDIKNRSYEAIYVLIARPMEYIIARELLIDNNTRDKVKLVFTRDSIAAASQNYPYVTGLWKMPFLSYDIKGTPQLLTETMFGGILKALILSPSHDKYDIAARRLSDSHYLLGKLLQYWSIKLERGTGSESLVLAISAEPVVAYYTGHGVTRATNAVKPFDTSPFIRCSFSYEELQATEEIVSNHLVNEQEISSLSKEIETLKAAARVDWGTLSEPLDKLRQLRDARNTFLLELFERKLGYDADFCINISIWRLILELYVKYEPQRKHLEGLANNPKATSNTMPNTVEDYLKAISGEFRKRVEAPSGTKTAKVANKAPQENKASTTSPPIEAYLGSKTLARAFLDKDIIALTDQAAKQIFEEYIETELDTDDLATQIALNAALKDNVWPNVTAPALSADSPLREAPDLFKPLPASYSPELIKRAFKLAIDIDSRAAAWAASQSKQNPAEALVTLASELCATRDNAFCFTQDQRFVCMTADHNTIVISDTLPGLAKERQACTPQMQPLPSNAKLSRTDKALDSLSSWLTKAGITKPELVIELPVSAVESIYKYLEEVDAQLLKLLKGFHINTDRKELLQSEANSFLERLCILLEIDFKSGTIAIKGQSTKGLRVELKTLQILQDISPSSKYQASTALVRESIALPISRELQQAVAHQRLCIELELSDIIPLLDLGITTIGISKLRNTQLLQGNEYYLQDYALFYPSDTAGSSVNFACALTPAPLKLR